MTNPNPAQQLHLQTDTLGDNLLSEWMLPHYRRGSLHRLASVNRAYVAASFGLIDDMKHKAKESIRRILGFFMRIEARVRRRMRSNPFAQIGPPSASRSGRQNYWGERRMFPRGSHFEAQMRQLAWEELGLVLKGYDEL
jgi:hypothetical protein